MLAPPWPYEMPRYAFTGTAPAPEPKPYLPLRYSRLAHDLNDPWVYLAFGMHWMLRPSPPTPAWLARMHHKQPHWCCT